MNTQHCRPSFNGQEAALLYPSPLVYEDDAELSLVIGISRNGRKYSESHDNDSLMFNGHRIQKAKRVPCGVSGKGLILGVSRSVG